MIDWDDEEFCDKLLTMVGAIIEIDHGFDDVFGTPHGLDIAAIAQSMGISAKTISSQKELMTELSEPVRGISVVVINAPHREANADFLKEIYKNVSSM